MGPGFEVSKFQRPHPITSSNLRLSKPGPIISSQAIPTATKPAGMLHCSFLFHSKVSDGTVWLTPTTISLFLPRGDRFYPLIKSLFHERRAIDPYWAFLSITLTKY